MKYLSLRNNDWFDEFDRMLSPVLRSDYYQSTLKTDIQDKGDHYLFEIDVAGAPKDSIKAELDNGYLNVSVSKSESKDSNEGYIRRERRYTSSSRSFYVGDVTEQDITADYKDGVLTISVKKETERLPKSTQIKIGQ